MKERLETQLWVVRRTLLVLRNATKQDHARIMVLEEEERDIVNQIKDIR